MWRREPYVEENGFGFDVESAAPGRESSPNAGPERGLRLADPELAEKNARDLATLEAVVARAETGAGPTPSSVSPRAPPSNARAPTRARAWAPGEAFPARFRLPPRRVQPRLRRVHLRRPGGRAAGSERSLSRRENLSRTSRDGREGPGPGPGVGVAGLVAARVADLAGEPRRRRERRRRRRRRATPRAGRRVPAGGVPGFGHATRRAESRKSRRRLGGLGLDAEGPGGDHPRARGRRGRRGLTGVDAQPEPRAVRRERGASAGAAAAAGVALAALDVARLDVAFESYRAPGATASGAMRARRRRRSGTRTRAEPRGRGWTCEGTRAARCFTNAPRIFSYSKRAAAQTAKKLFFTSCAATNDQRQERKERTRFRRQRTSASFPAPGLPLRPRASTFRARIHRP